MGGIGETHVPRFLSTLGVSPPSKNCLLFLHAFVFTQVFSLGHFFCVLICPLIGCFLSLLFSLGF